MILLYENDKDHIDFLKMITNRLPELVPKIVDINDNDLIESN